MRFTVVWKPSAKNELAKIWIDADDRERVRAAADRIDQFLGEPSSDFGHTIHGIRRVLIVRPLAVEFAVSETDCLVTVARIARVDDRPSP